MGTRGAYAFRTDEKDKVIYNQFDTYPSGLGHSIAQFIQEYTDEEIIKTAQNIELVDAESQPTEDQIEHCREKGTIDTGVGGQSELDWYCLIRGAQGNPWAYAAGLKYMIDSNKFLTDSLFCEYAYIINCDTMELEFYKGFNKNPNAPGRYAKLANDHGYHGVSLVSVFSFVDMRRFSPEEMADAMEIAILLTEMSPDNEYFEDDAEELKELLRRTTNDLVDFTKESLADKKEK